jgi:hypothetical protein
LKDPEEPGAVLLDQQRRQSESQSLPEPMKRGIERAVAVLRLKPVAAEERSFSQSFDSLFEDFALKIIRSNFR